MINFASFFQKEDTCLVVEWARVQAVAGAKQSHPPVRDDKLPSFAQRVCKELDGRLGQSDRWEPECIQRIDAAAYETEANANRPHAKSEAWQSRVIGPESDSSGEEDLLRRRSGFLYGRVC